MAVGVIRLFVCISHVLHTNPERAVRGGLDEIAADYGDLAYIGSRRTLQQLVLKQAQQIWQRVQSVREEDLAHLAESHPELERRLRRIKQHSDGEYAAAEWFGRQWRKDSGVFPDFVLAWDESETFANGAVVELKDSKGDVIASFNSTIPTRFKSLNEMQHIMGSRLVVNAAMLRDYPHSTEGKYLYRPRYCFYLVRTRSGDLESVRISLVEGSFFEALPKGRLLEEVWNQVLAESGVPEAKRAGIVERLKRLEQSEIARSRIVEKASVKPRLRLMAEVHPDGNVHSYTEIAPRTINLVLKREEGYDDQWLQQRLVEEGCTDAAVQRKGENKWLTLTVQGGRLRLRCFSIWHRRNGEHLVLQYQLP